MSLEAARLWTLVLAGGDGTRLHALTRLVSGAPIPKQYCRLLAGRSLLEATLDRVRPLAPRDRTLAVVTRHHLPVAADQLAALPASNVLVQPRNCDTGPGLLFGLLALARRQPDALVAVFPSDHYVGDEPRLRAAVGRAARLVHVLPSTVALLGIAPSEPDAELGYIELADPLRMRGARGAFRVARFREKPSRTEARALIAAGGLWNSFVMVFQLRRVLELVAGVRPADVAALERVADEPDTTYATLRPWNFSRDFLAHVPEHLVVVRSDGTGWSDWGTPGSVARTLAPLDGWAAPWGHAARSAAGRPGARVRVAGAGRPRLEPLPDRRAGRAAAAAGAAASAAGVTTRP